MSRRIMVIIYWEGLRPPQTSPRQVAAESAN